MKQRRISELDSVLHLQEILRGVYPEFIESAQNDNCEIRDCIKFLNGFPRREETLAVDF